MGNIGYGPGAQAFFDELEAATMPRILREQPRPGGPGGLPAGALRPLLANARMRLHAVRP